MKNLIVLGLIVLLSSCAIFRKVEKNRKVLTSDSTNIQSERSFFTDTSKMITIDRIDSTVVSPELNILHTFKLKSFQDGMYFPGFVDVMTKLDTAMVWLSINYDSLQNSIKVMVKKRSEVIPVKIDRKVIVLNGVSYTTSVDKNTHTKKTENVINKNIEPDVTWMWVLAGLLTAIGIILYVLYRLRS